MSHTDSEVPVSRAEFETLNGRVAKLERKFATFIAALESSARAMQELARICVAAANRRTESANQPK